jgi:ribosomal protein L44E
MNRLQAAMRESAPRRQTHKLKKVAYKIGSFFKGCAFCGDTEEKQVGSRMKVVYLSGYNVWRAYVPRRVNWTYWCYDCGAKDGQCWDNARDIGLDAIRGSRSAIKELRRQFHRGLSKDEPVERPKVEAVDPLEKELTDLRVQIEAILRK